MNVIKNTFLTLVCATTLVSCAGADAWLVKNTGLTTTDAILLSVKTKDRVELTLKEYKDAKSRNLPSGKEVIVVSPDIVTTPSEPAKDSSILDSLSSFWNLF